MSQTETLEFEAQANDVNLKRKELHHKCEVCNKYCKTKLCLKIHKQCHRKYRTSLHRCNVCHLTYTKRYVLNSHIRFSHLKSKLKDLNDNGSYSPHCMCCKRKFISVFDLKKHLMPTLSQVPSLCRSFKLNNVQRIDASSLIKRSSSSICLRCSSLKYRSNDNTRNNGQNHPSNSTESDSDLDDAEFISLLYAYFREEISEEDIGSLDLSYLKNDYQEVILKKESKPLPQATDPLDSDMMVRFLHTLTFIDRPAKDFKCLPCQGAFSGEAALLDHLHLHFCHICGTSFTKRARLPYHLSEHKAKPTFNMKFDRTFIRDMFEKYTEISDDGKILTCNICPKLFTQQSYLFIHMYTHAQNLPIISKQVSPKVNKIPISANRFSFHADPAYTDSTNTFYTNVDSLSRGAMSREANRDSTSRDSDQPRERSFPCPKCNKSFFTRNNLRGHMETHDQTERFLCSTCGKGFRRKRAMLKHCEGHSPGVEEEDNVPEINANDNSETTLTQEIVDAPTYEKQLQSASGKFIVAACFTPQKLIPDQKPIVDNRERKFGCPTCNKMFLSKDNLRGHVAIHNPKKYFCSVCNRGFRRRLTMERHVETHTNTV